MFRPGHAWTVFILAGLATVAVHARMALLPPAPEGVLPALAWFGIAFVIYLAGAGAARRLRLRAPGPVLVWAFLVAAASLAVHLPGSLLLSNEVQRYRFDGSVGVAGYNPYTVAPADSGFAALRAGFDPPVPHPDRTALYPPLAEMGFYALARTGRDSVLDYRLLASVVALLAGGVLVLLARGIGLPVVNAVFFLWHPLIIVESGVNGHVDVLALFFLLLSLTLLVFRHELGPLTTLALATLVKIYPAALFPLYLRRIPVYRTLLFFLVVLLGVLPFSAAGPRLLHGLFDYLGHARANPGPYLLLESVFDALGRPEWTRIAVGGLGAAILVWLTATDDGSGESMVRRAFYLALPPVLLGPVVNPWYLVWLIPFLTLLRQTNPWRMPLLFLSGSIALGYVGVVWGAVPAWVAGLEFGPAALLLAWALWRRSRGGLLRLPEAPAPGAEAGT